MYSSGLFLPNHYAKNTRRLSVYGILQASVPESPVDTDDMGWDLDQVDIILTRPQCHPGTCAMLVTGDSMDDGSEKAIRNGDIVLVNPNITFSGYHNTQNTVISTQNGYIVKERGLHDGKHMLLSRNPEYPPVRFEAGWQMVGIVYAVYLGPKRVRYL